MGDAPVPETDVTIEAIDPSSERYSALIAERRGDRGRLPPFSVAIRGSELRSVLSDISRRG
jgi:hypothetical protein